LKGNLYKSTYARVEELYVRLDEKINKALD